MMNIRAKVIRETSNYDRGEVVVIVDISKQGWATIVKSCGGIDFVDISNLSANDGGDASHGGLLKR